jgi:hypothetical protein
MACANCNWAAKMPRSTRFISKVRPRASASSCRLAIRVRPVVRRAARTLPIMWDYRLTVSRPAAVGKNALQGVCGIGAATSGRWRALRQRLLISMNFAVLASRSGKECRCALSHTLNSSLAQRVAMISGCDWGFASRNAGAVFIVCDDSFSHRDAGSIYCVVVSAGQGASV